MTPVLASQIEHWPVERLIPYARNARTHSAAQVEQIARSITEFGFTNPILVDRAQGILAGHGRLQGAQLLKMPVVPVIVLDYLTEAQRRAYILADNKLAMNAGWDDDLLAAELREIQAMDFGLDVIGFDDRELAKLLGEPDDEAADACPDVPEQAVTAAGDLWVLGRHRLLCGDATKREDVERVMAGARADMVFTDPPYNIASENKGFAAGSDNRQMAVLMASEWDKHFNPESALSCLHTVLADNVTVYVCTSHHLAPVIWAWMSGWSDYCGWCVWSKPNPMPSLSKRHWTWSAELICYATRGKHTFNFPNDGHAPNVWTFTKSTKCDLHPTMKPVSVPSHAILHSSKARDIILDLFSGSGSTLIACEVNDRAARLMEIDPRYCDVIVKRWQTYTGKQATRERDGRTFDELTP
jgi:DNA modification methylase